ncbi:hypothetical protein DRP53_08205 [candidate division WOR-3 bacterium]|uniref:T9SS type A sorting domain-containing protein n=1 Tax=candidate division WOR-3 bacterium TaxID=2052148 RepID=A0A660SFT2_UNCW3|nr:MAG: hypothetical protein DRP53_08205 [candidate division WOR-3 bacterium]
MRFLIPLSLVIGIASAAWIPTGSPVAREPEFVVLESNNSGTIIQVTVPGVIITSENINGKVYKVVSLAGELAAFDDKVGLPQVPTVPGVIAIPDHSQPEVEVVDASYVDIPNILLKPCQPPTTDMGETYPFTIDEQVYRTDRFFPEHRAELLYTGYWRDLYTTTVKVLPIAYNPKMKTLRIYQKLTLRVKYDGSFPTKIIEPDFARLYRALIKNYRFLPILEGRTDEKGCQYLVICNSAYTSTIQPLVDWHHKQGLDVRVISKSSFSAAEIKDSIQKEYNSHTPAKLKWVLLVGDVNRVPTYTGWGVPCSDVWYVDFDLNYRAEVAIGRLSCDNTSDLTNQINKTLKFMKDPEMGTWLEKSVLVAHKEQYPYKYSQCKRQIFTYDYGFYKYTMDTLMGAKSGVSNTSVTNAINEGRVIVNYRGHGDATIWWRWNNYNQNWSTTDVMNLNNGNKTPIVLNICCVSGRISVEDCLNEVWLEKYPGGAVASWAASDPSYTTPNHALDKAFYWAFGDNTSHGTPYQPPMWDIGWAGNFADFYMVNYGGGGGSTNYKMYLWCGDPALEVWRGQPSDPVVTHPTEIPTGNQNFTVTVSDSKAPIEDALVCVWKGNEVYEYGWTDASGQVTFQINPQTAGTMWVTASPHNFKPYEGTCQVTVGVAEGESSQSMGIWLKSTLANRGVVIRYALPDRETMKINLYDAIGRELVSREVKVTGSGTLTLPTDWLSNGIYFLKVESKTASLDESVLILR